MTRFTEELRSAADPIYQAIFDHPFVRGIADGTLRKEQLIHYVKQDFEYLNAYIRIYGIAISRCEDRAIMALFNEQISFILNSETHPHQNFCYVAGVTYEEMQGYPLAPSANHYIRHMLNVAHEGALEDVIAALLPCPWTYMEIGQKLIEEVNPDESHPFYEWMHFYGDREFGITEQLRRLLDEWAESLSQARKDRLKEHFLTSCQLEYMFWDMAFALEAWPVDLLEATEVGR
ncbi:aminopyrimidine aminohydrolase [Paenibacillus sp. J23TS9]|uniref:thiaminase II n=1 Tax=Paenibacillus sp. J23TS9 TaxID=2807193 RepID=UPI001B100CD4|nr:thiaminase II [Paenibacillus sp. J23TS9]GIP24975.1 aminopyrimidine aminohydrolase [Paenibacillus sp. J23TS9]